MKKKVYSSLDEIRSEKEHAQRMLKHDVSRLKNDVTDCFVPSNNIFLQSSNKFLNYIGYAIFAYKTAASLKSMFRFFTK